MRTLLMFSAGLTALSTAAFPAWGEEVTDLEQAVPVAPITVVGTRTQRRVDDVPASVSVITAETIENNLVTDI